MNERTREKPGPGVQKELGTGTYVGRQGAAELISHWIWVKDLPGTGTKGNEYHIVWKAVFGKDAGKFSMQEVSVPPHAGCAAFRDWVIAYVKQQLGKAITANDLTVYHHVTSLDDPCT